MRIAGDDSAAATLKRKCFLYAAAPAESHRPGPHPPATLVRGWCDVVLLWLGSTCGDDGWLVILGEPRLVRLCGDQQAVQPLAQRAPQLGQPREPGLHGAMDVADRALLLRRQPGGILRRAAMSGGAFNNFMKHQINGCAQTQPLLRVACALSCIAGQAGTPWRQQVRGSCL